jgi:transformation/transcription domain-associated protein
VDDRAADDLFVKSLDGLVSGIHLSNVEPAANELLREVAKALFEMELSKETGPVPGRKLAIAPITGQFLDSVVAVLMTRPNGNHTSARRLIANIIQELHDRGQGEDQERKRNTAALVGTIVSKFVAFCWQTEWRKKVAGCAGVSVLISDEIHLGYDWPYTREVEICRSLVTALKDMPPDPPAEVPEIKKTMIELIRFCNPPLFGDQMEVDGGTLDRTKMSPEEQAHYDWVHKPVAEKGKAYMNLIHPDLHSPNKTVRETTHECLALFADLSGVKLAEFVRPLVDRVTSNIYGKPLRMFSAMVQIGHMESMTYLLNLDPPVVESSEELWRLLNEVVALAEADEQATHPMNPMHKLGRRATQLNAMTKAAAIRLVTAAFPITEYFQKQPTIRQRYV